jgi:hypothetical protein
MRVAAARGKARELDEVGEQKRVQSHHHQSASPAICVDA